MNVAAIRPETPPPVFGRLLTGYFREGRGYATWRPGGTDDWLLIATLAGRGRFGHADGAFLSEPGDLVLLRPGTRHDYGVEPTRLYWELVWAHFQPEPGWHEWLGWPEEAPGLMRIRPNDPALRDKIIARFAEAHHLAIGPLPRRDDFAMNALEEVLLWCDAQNPRSGQARLDGRVRVALEYLCRHYAEKVSIETLAQVSGQSPSRLAHLFRRQVGMTPLQFLERQRLARAQQFLELTPRTVQSIAAEVGYDNPFYFTLRFKRHTGLSPRDYRKGRGIPEGDDA